MVDIQLWLIVLVLAGILLLFMYIRNPRFTPFIWFGRACVMLVLGAFFLFCANLIGQFMDVYVPFNLATLSVAAILGIPGIVALMAILWFLF